MKSNELRRSLLITVFALTCAVLAACENTNPVQSTPSPSPSASASPATASSPAGSPVAASKVDSLLGRWMGPEGTSLNVSRKGDKYSVELTDLDGTKTYDATAKGDILEFTRSGKSETIRPATGIETGMKGFEKETNCVLVTKGSEGFCRK